MAILTTGSFILPQEYANGVWSKAQSTSVLARLSAAKPQKFGVSNVMVLTGPVKAELVGEGAEKSPTNPTYTNKSVVPLKFQTTVRVTDEVLWADEDYKIGIMEDIADQCGIALGRALDLAGIHKINPLTGAVASTITEGLVDSTNVVTVSGTDYDKAVEDAAGLVIDDGHSPNGVALDTALAFKIATMRDGEGRKLYPDFGLGEISNFSGLNSATGDTVSGVQEIAAPDNVAAVVGDFSAFRWGVQRQIEAELIQYGDPDGLGDLKRQNQVAVRLEVVYGIGIFDLNAFGIVKTA